MAIDPFRLDQPADPDALERLFAQVAALDDPSLAALEGYVAELRFNRAIDAADPDALIEVGHNEGFKSNGMPTDPFVRAGIVICTGTRIDRSATSHHCAFVSLGDNWVWESDFKLGDDIRYPAGPKKTMRSVTLLAAPVGTELHLVTSKATMNKHEMTEVRSFKFDGRALVQIPSRSRPKNSGHR